MIGVSACTTTPGAQSLAASPPTSTPVRIAYDDTAYTASTTDAAPQAARSGEDGSRVDLMPIGGPTPAPMGFLDLCQRSPADCQHAAAYQPEKIRTLARAATAERYRLAFASLRQKTQGDDNADMQSASVTPPAGDDAPAAATGSVQYLTWPARNAGGPLGYVQPLRQPGLQPLPGLVAPAANGYVSDFLDLSVTPGAWTQLGAAAPAPARPAGDVQPGAVSNDGDHAILLNWSHKSDADDHAAVVSVSAETIRAPSIQYDIPDEPFDWAHVRVPAPAARDERQATQTQLSAQADDQAQGPADYQRITMDTHTARLVRAVNDQVNSIMRGATDQEVYHVADYWNAPPLVRGVRGDCEDFALEKRRLLIENGIPAAAISIAIVRTRLGEDHAVLIVSSWQGDYVLDNLQYDVRPWRKAGYTWVSRQGPGDDLSWVSLAPANNRSPWQARTIRVAYAQ